MSIREARRSTSLQPNTPIPPAGAARTRRSSFPNDLFGSGRILAVVKLNVVNARRGQRSCDECTACCTTCAVVELGKPLNTPCPHVTARGCGIYDSRPGSCRAYDCAWLQGHLPEKYRPDRCGIVFTFERIDGFNGLLVHAMIMNDQVPLDRVEYLYNMLRQTMPQPLMLQIIPHDLRAPAHAKINGRPIRPGVYVAVEDATGEP